MSASVIASDQATDYRPHRLTIDRYYQMIEAGIFSAHDAVFLWKGRLVEKMTIGRPHTIALIRLFRLLNRLVPEGCYLEQGQPMILGDDAVPEPDLKVVRGALEDYPHRPPGSRDVPFVVEIAETSLAVDSGAVLETYARERIPAYWIVNLPKRRIDVYSEPTGPADRPTYRLRHHFGPGEEVPVVLDGVEVGRVAVNDVLP